MTARFAAHPAAPGLCSDGRRRSVADPTVSIVIINHNYAPYLLQAIDSALKQTRPAAEVIVVDDGSTDQSRHVIAGFGDRIRPVLHHRGGPVRAFNLGVELAQGEIVLVLDADDYLYANCLAEVTAAWRPNLSKLQFQLNTVDAEGRDQNMPFPYFPPDLDEFAVLDQCLRFGAYPWTVCSGNAFSCELLKAVLPIDPELIFKSPDGYVNKLAPLYGGVKSLNRPLGAYRVHGANVWAQSGAYFRIKPIADNVRLDVAMHRVFVAFAAARGFEIAPFDEICVPNQVEIRLLARRFLGPAGDSADLDALSRIGAQSVARAPNISGFGKLVWRLWFWLIREAPLPLVERLHLLIRSQAGRPAWVRRSARWVRGAAR